MKKKANILIAVAILLCGFTASQYSKSSNVMNEIPESTAYNEISGAASVITYNNLDELETNASLVFVGTVLDSLEDGIITDNSYYSEKGYLIPCFYTSRAVTVDQVFQGEIDIASGSSITIAQSVMISDDQSTPEIDVYKYDDEISILEEGRQYLFFVNPSGDGNHVYFPIGIQGEYKIEDLVTMAMARSTSESDIQSIAAEIKNKYVPMLDE